MTFNINLKLFDNFLLGKEEIGILELWFILIRKKLSNINLSLSSEKAWKQPRKNINTLQRRNDCSNS